MTNHNKAALLAATSLTVFTTGAALAEEWDVRVGGYYNAMVAYASNDPATGNGLDDENGLEHAHQGEFYVRPTITLDNGIQISARMDFEINEDGLEADEPDLTISGSFGSLVLGSNEDADMGRLIYSAPNAAIVSLNDADTPDYIPWYPGSGGSLFRNDLAINAFNALPVQGLQSGVNRANPFNFGAAILSSTNPGNDARSEGRRISYFTPRFAGFQLGVSYANTDEASPNPLRDCSANSCNLFDIGASYAGNFGGVDLAAGLGYSWADTNDPNADPTLVRGSLSIGFGGYTIGGSFAEQNGSSGGEYDGNSFSIGANYTEGPWSFGINYFNGRMTDHLHIGFGPRVELSSAFIDVSYQANERTNLSVFLGHVSYREDVGDGGFGTPGDNLDSFVIGTGIGLSF